MKISPLRFNYFLTVLGSLAFIAVLAAWNAAVQDGPWSTAPRLLMPVAVISAGAGVMFFKKREEKRTRSGSEDGVEKELSGKAASAVFLDTLILLTALGVAYAVFGTFASPVLAIFLLLVLIVADFFLRLSVLSKRMA